MKREIKVKDINDIQKINQIVCRYDYDIWIHSKSGMVDAKSLLGMFAFGLKEQMFIVTEDNVNTTKLFKDLSDYIEFEE